MFYTVLMLLYEQLTVSLLSGSHYTIEDSLDKGGSMFTTYWTEDSEQ